MALTNAQLKTQLRAMGGFGTSSQDSTLIQQALNAAARDVWMAWEWPERLKEAFITTVLPYDTGTVALTNAATTCVGTGTTFASFSAKAKKIALAYGQPPYRVTYVGATSLTLERNYVADTDAAAAYVLYADEYDVASDVDTLQAVRLHHERPNGRLPPLARATLDELDYLPSATGRPLRWALAPEVTAGTLRIQVHPIPDAVYSLSCLYLKSYTDMSADGDFCDVAESRRDLVVWHALEFVYMLAEKDDKAAFAKHQYETGLARALYAEASVRPMPMRMAPFDRSADGRGVWWPYYRV